MSYTREQRHMIRLGLRLSRHAPTRVRKSLLEAMAVESSFRNLSYGDRDSQGVLQQRPSTGWGAPGNAKRDIKQYLSRARAENRGFHGTAGQLAQSVQGSAFPGRYDQHKGEASALLRRFGAGGGGGRAATLGGAARAPTSDGRREFAMQLLEGLQSGQPLDAAGLTSAIQGLHTAQQHASAPRRGPASGGASSSKGPGQMVAALAARQIGQPYVWGGESRKEGGFDCSGLIYAAYRKLGVAIPRVAADQGRGGKAVSFKHLRAGDVIVARDGHHAVLYIGHGRVIVAPHTGTVVQYARLADFPSSSYRARRYL